MLSIMQTTETLASVTHTLISLSVIVSHLVANDPLGAIHIAASGCLLLVVVTLVGCGCELIRWKVRQRTRNSELSETKVESGRPGG